jgi:putative transcriptional regulator
MAKNSKVKKLHKLKPKISKPTKVKTLKKSKTTGRRNNNISPKDKLKNNENKEITFGEGLIAGAKEILEYHQGDKTKADIRMVEIKPVPEIKISDIKNIREKFHLSQKMLAEILNVSYRTVESWEHGKNKPSGGSARLLSMMKEDDALLENFELIHKIV